MMIESRHAERPGFSPGLGCPIWAHNFLAGRLASHGFAVAVICHYGNAFFPGSQQAEAAKDSNKAMPILWTATLAS